MTDIVPFNTAIKNAQTNQELQRYINRQLKKSIKVQLPVRVIEVDHVKQHCDVEVLVKEMNDVGKIHDVGILANVPIRYTNETGIAYVRLPIQVGDTGTVEFFDCSIANYKVQGVKEYHFDEDYHSLDSPLYTSGFYAEKNVFPLADVDNTAIEIGTKQGTFILNIDMIGNLIINCLGSATINAGTSLTLNSPSIMANGNMGNSTGISAIVPIGSTVLTFTNGGLTNYST